MNVLTEEIISVGVFLSFLWLTNWSVKMTTCMLAITIHYKQGISVHMYSIYNIFMFFQKINYQASDYVKQFYIPFSESIQIMLYEYAGCLLG